MFAIKLDQVHLVPLNVNQFQFYRNYLQKIQSKQNLISNLKFICVQVLKNVLIVWNEINLKE